MEIALEVDSVDEVAGAHRRVPRNAHARRAHRQAQDAAQAGRDWARSFRRSSRRAPARKSSRREGFSLYDYPVLTCWPDDGGPFITLPMVFSRNPDTGKRNCGMYRMQVYDERTTGMHWQTHKQGAEHYRRACGGRQTDAHGRRGRHRLRSRDHVFGDSAAAARSRRDDDRRLPARQSGRDGEVQDRRSRSSGQRRDRARRLRRTGRTAHRRPVRRSHRLLFAGRRVPGLPRHLRHAAQRTRSTRPPSSARRPWRTSTWARRSSASSCR